MKKNNITTLKAIIIFILATSYFYLLLFTLLPFIKSHFLMNPALYWFIIGYFLFIPLFAYALWEVKKEGHKDRNNIFSALNIRAFNKKDWIYSVIGLLLVFVGTGIIFGLSFYLHKQFGTRMLNTSPWFMKIKPFQGWDKLYLLVWLPMFFFNIVGEELLWRGYIQSRLNGKYSWLLCSCLWTIFHIPFGIDMIIMLIPALIIIPYVFYKTQNSLTGIFIHAIYNGPIFIIISLGLMK